MSHYINYDSADRLAKVGFFATVPDVATAIHSLGEASIKQGLFMIISYRIGERALLVDTKRVLDSRVSESDFLGIDLFFQKVCDLE